MALTDQLVQIVQQSPAESCGNNGLVLLASLIKKLLAGKSATIVSEFAGKKIVREPVPIERDEPLKLELQHFIESVRAHRDPLVTGEAGKQALEIAMEITEQIRKS